MFRCRLANRPEACACRQTAVPILETKLLGNRLGARPVDKFSLDFFAILVSAESAIPAVSSEGDPSS